MIPWEKYSEDELRKIIKVYYKERGFNVDDLHEADRRGEKGADLIVYKPSESEKIAIALKVKPKKSDIYQLQELGNRTERQKKYIYIETPATDFYFAMDKHKNVDFWDSKKLEYEISSGHPSVALWIIVSNSPLFACIAQIEHSLRLVRLKWDNKEKFEGKDLSDPNFYREIWRLKDDFSSLHKSLRLLQGIFEYDLERIESLPIERQNYTLEHILNYMGCSTYSVENIVQIADLYSHFSKFIKEYGKMVSSVVEGTHDRSNWFYYINGLDTSLMPGRVLSELSSEVEEQMNLKSPKVSIVEKLIEERLDRRECQGRSYEISRIWQRLSASAGMIEVFIDDLFSCALEKTFREEA